MADLVEQNVALCQEALVSARLIRAGLSALQAIDGANDFYHLPMLTLASGIERLLKIMICLGIEHRTGRFPTRSELLQGRSGHDLEHLLDRVVDMCYDEKCRERPAVVDDYMRLESGGRLRKVVRVLSKFAQSSRYYHLDVVTGVTPSTDPPDAAWEALESEVLRDYGDIVKQLKKDPTLQSVYERINFELVGSIERLVRALTRLMTLSDLGWRAKSISTMFHDWLMLTDAQLGKQTYLPAGGGVV